MLDTRGRRQTRRDASPFADLRAFGDRLALTTPTLSLSYAELGDRIDETVEALGPGRRLVLIAGSNGVDAIVTYLAALKGGNPVLLVPGDDPCRLQDLVAAYNPDVVYSAPAGGDYGLDQRRSDSAHDLHPDLSLLLSTSGSTGSSKLVRLSRDNLRSNAASIADFLSISSADRAATSLPMHYCYGLSVINSHLHSGGGLVVTDASVVDPCFWDLFQSAGATSLAGVPYTFDLLDRCGFSDLDLPHLRFVTQAGGRLAPGKVARYAALGRRRGWDFVVMYGQTEATARISYLPAALAGTRPAAIGVPIPGGSLRLEPTAEFCNADCGELVYSGPNVMMGYAERPADLSIGPTVRELRTGDLARRDDQGIYEIVGRKSRFVKVFGLRIDLDGVERFLEGRGIAARCVCVGDDLYVFVTRHAEVAPTQVAVAEHCSLPSRVVRAAQIEIVPVTDRGKTDYLALERHANTLGRRPAGAENRPVGGTTSAGRLRDLYAELLGRPDATQDSSFVSLGGDSLSYVELSIQLGDRLEKLPRDWPTRTIRDLASTSSGKPTRGATLETGVLLRATAIVMIVGTHANLFILYGGAHCLLALAGYNVARFQLGNVSRLSRLRSGLTAITQIAAPSMAWIGLVALTVGTYRPETVFFLNGLLGSDTWTLQWQFWFVETLLWTLTIVFALMAVPAVDALDRRSPFGLALSVLLVALALRYALVGVEAGPTERYTPVIVFWCFAVGWTAAKATCQWHRVMVAFVSIVGVIGFFGEPQREAVVA
nr:non-ribosomal peptide synthetase [Propionibacteriales bacterium]